MTAYNLVRIEELTEVESLDDSNVLLLNDAEKSDDLEQDTSESDDKYEDLVCSLSKSSFENCSAIK